MAQIIIMPKEGITVESCLVGAWRKEVGDPVATDDVLFEYETDKAAFECVSTASGILLHRFFRQGDEAPVLAPVAIVGEKGEDFSALIAGAGGAAEGAAPAAPQEAMLRNNVPAAPHEAMLRNNVPAAPAAPQEAMVRNNVPAAPAAPLEAMVRNNVPAAPAAPVASPRARGFADAQGVDLGTVIPTGPNGRILEADVIKAANATYAAPYPAGPAHARDPVMVSPVAKPPAMTGPAVQAPPPIELVQIPPAVAAPEGMQQAPPPIELVQIPPAVGAPEGTQQAPPPAEKMQAPPAVAATEGLQQAPPPEKMQIPPPVGAPEGLQQAPPAELPQIPPIDLVQAPPAVAAPEGFQQAPPAVAAPEGPQQIPPAVAGLEEPQQAPPAVAAPAAPEGPQLMPPPELVFPAEAPLAQADSAQARAAARAAARAQPPQAGGGGVAYEDVAFSNIRSVIGKAMMASLQRSAQLTHHHSFDATNVLALREDFKASDEALGYRSVSVGDIILYVTSRVLARHPEINALVAETGIRKCYTVNLGVAVDTPRGLIVPTIFSAEKKSLREISGEVRSLASAAREGRLSPDQMKGGTFTVSNLGATGVEMFTPIINPPQAAIVGICGVTERMHKGKGGRPESYPAIGVSLTYDHRAIDGAPASRFAAELCKALSEFSWKTLAHELESEDIRERK